MSKMHADSMSCLAGGEGMGQVSVWPLVLFFELILEKGSRILSTALFICPKLEPLVYTHLFFSLNQVLIQYNHSCLTNRVLATKVTIEKIKSTAHLLCRVYQERKQQCGLKATSSQKFYNYSIRHFFQSVSKHMSFTKKTFNSPVRQVQIVIPTSTMRT